MRLSEGFVNCERERLGSPGLVTRQQKLLCFRPVQTSVRLVTQDGFTEVEKSHHFLLMLKESHSLPGRRHGILQDFIQGLDITYSLES